MLEVSGTDVKCPICGTVNRSLDLEETDGWMECEHCGNTVQLMKYVRTRRISKKYDIFEISKRIGHKSVKTTQDTYGHLFTEVQRNIADDLNSMRR